MDLSLKTLRSPISLQLIFHYKHLIILFPRSRNEAKGGVQFRDLRKDVSRMPPEFRKVGNGSFLMATECLNTRFPGSLCLPCYMQDKAWS